jgi:hypothetical protein
VTGVKLGLPHLPTSVLDQLMSKMDNAAFDGKDTLDFSDTMSMVKTDNDWEEAREFQTRVQHFGPHDIT